MHFCLHLQLYWENTSRGSKEIHSGAFPNQARVNLTSSKSAQINNIILVSTYKYIRRWLQKKSKHADNVGPPHSCIPVARQYSGVYGSNAILQCIAAAHGTPNPAECTGTTTRYRCDKIRRCGDGIWAILIFYIRSTLFHSTGLNWRAFEKCRVRVQNNPTTRTHIKAVFSLQEHMGFTYR